MKILFILPEYYPHSGGGISTYYISYIRSLKPYCSKIKVIVGSGYTHENKNIIFEGIEIEFLKPELFYKYILKFKKFDIYPEFQKNIAAAWAMYEQSNYGEDYDIIECVDFGHGYIPWLVKKIKPVVTRLHGSAGQIELNEANSNISFMGDLNRLTEINLLDKSDILLTYSKINQTYWNKNFGYEKVKFINPTFELSSNLAISNQSKTVFALVCGRVQEWKGPKVLCKSLSHTVETIPTIEWIGRDTNYSKNKNTTEVLINEYPDIWNKKITHLPPLGNKEMLSKQKQTKFGIIPSTWDMFNFTCVEFLSQGVPVICSNNAGCSSLIVNGINGFTYDNNDPKQLADCLQRANKLTDNEYETMCLEALKSIKNNLSSEKTILKNFELYGELTGKHIIKTESDFIKTVYEPNDFNFSLSAMLDQQPLKNILKYISSRIKNKLKI